MIELTKTPILGQVLPLERDAAQASIQIGKKSYEARDVINMLLVTLEGLSRELGSSDRMVLAMYSVLDKKPKGMSKEDFEELVQIIFKRVNTVRCSNPINTLWRI